MKSEPVVSLEHVSALVRAGWSIEDVSFVVGRGEVVALVGANGSGKSLALRVAAGLEAPMSGEVRLFGTDPYHAGPDDNVELRQRVGVVFDQHALLSNMTVFNNVALPLRYHTLLSEPEIESRVTAALEAWGVGGLRHYFPADLALGDGRLVALARALVMDPDILFIEEMLVGLDAGALARLRDFFETTRRSRRQAVVVSANAPSPLLEHVDRLFFFRAGRLVATGRPTELTTIRDPAVQEMFSL
jgi:phospholipid/cholesterol/gamma-HCH transport system ATP-binding protein